MISEVTKPGLTCAVCRTPFKVGDLVFMGMKCWGCCHSDGVALDGRPYCPPPPPDERKVEALRLAYKKVRIDAELTLRGAARILGVTPQHLSLIECGPAPEFVWSDDDTSTKTCIACSNKFKARLLVCKEKPEMSPALPIWEKLCPACNTRRLGND